MSKGRRRNILAKDLEDLGQEFELACCRQLLAVRLFVLGCGTQHSFAKTRDLFVCKFVEDVVIIFFAFLYARALFRFKYGIELHVKAELVRWDKSSGMYQQKRKRRTFLWGKIVEVFLGDLFPLALFLSLTAIGVACASLDFAFLFYGAFLLVGVARLCGGNVLINGGEFLALAVLGDVWVAMSGGGAGERRDVPSSSEDSSEPSPKMSRARVWLGVSWLVAASENGTDL